MVGKRGGRVKAVPQESEAAAVSKERDLPIEQEETEKTIDDVARRVHERLQATTPARRTLNQQRDKEAQEVAGGISAESAVRAIADLQVEIGETLDRLAQTMAEQAKRLAALDATIAAKKRELADLADVEVAADALSALVREHEERTARLAGDAAAQKIVAERDVADARAAAEREKRRFLDDLEADKARAKREWQREQEEHAYTQKTQRAREDEDAKGKREALVARLAEEKEAHHKALAEVKARQERELGERERAVTAREDEHARLAARVGAFETELAKAVEGARDSATRAAEERARHVAELREKDVAGNERLLRLQIATLEKSVAEQAARIAELQAEARDSTGKVRDIALKAIEGASGANALARVSEIALQQAKGRGES